MVYAEDALASHIGTLYVPIAAVSNFVTSLAAADTSVRAVRTTLLASLSTIMEAGQPFAVDVQFPAKGVYMDIREPRIFDLVLRIQSGLTARNEQKNERDGPAAGGNTRHDRVARDDAALGLGKAVGDLSRLLRSPDIRVTRATFEASCPWTGA